MNRETNDTMYRTGSTFIYVKGTYFIQVKPVSTDGVQDPQQQDDL